MLPPPRLLLASDSGAQPYILITPESDVLHITGGPRSSMDQGDHLWINLLIHGRAYGSVDTPYRQIHQRRRPRLWIE